MSNVGLGQYNTLVVKGDLTEIPRYVEGFEVRAWSRGNMHSGWVSAHDALEKLQYLIADEELLNIVENALEDMHKANLL